MNIVWIFSSNNVACCMLTTLHIDHNVYINYIAFQSCVNTFSLDCQISYILFCLSILTSLIFQVRHLLFFSSTLWAFSNIVSYLISTLIFFTIYILLLLFTIFHSILFFIFFCFLSLFCLSHNLQLLVISLSSLKTQKVMVSNKKVLSWKQTKYKCSRQGDQG